MKALPLVSLLLVAACTTAPKPGEMLPRAGDEIVVAGQLFHTGTRVVLWSDPDGYDAYRTLPRFAAPAASRPATASTQPQEQARYNQRRNLPTELGARVAERGWSLPDLQQVVHLFVLHYDVAGTSRACFRVLQDVRSLSVHFLLDVDGTIYQTLDLKERAWHATIANDHAVGIEIAHIGAYPQPGHPILRSWYREDAAGPRIAFPGVRQTGILTPGFVARPARSELISGRIHGREYWQYDFTPEQYAALAKLTATLSRALPRIRLEAPRDAEGRLVTTVLTPEQLAAFEGIVGHFHVQANKQDPGPAFAWDWLLERARAY